MILKKTGDTTTVQAVGKSSEFAIRNSAQAFQILSSNLYTDKILAVIRELSCNAYDAHVSVGKAATPFEIQLPTSWEPIFRIRDFGPGLSDSDVKSLYCTYFASSKQDSNEMIGALGLGSKSPFCYTSGFTVISRHGGMARVYDAHVGESGTPEVVMLSQEKSDETGLEISFPVHVSDIAEFKQKAAVALEFFPVKPSTNVDISWITNSYEIKAEKWGVRHAGYGQRHLRVIAGNVAYKVTKFDIPDDDAVLRRLDFNEEALDLFFNIGDVEIAASRETLSNSKETVAVLVQRLHEILAEQQAAFQTSIDSLDNWGKVKAYYRLANDATFFGKALKSSLTVPERIKIVPTPNVHVKVTERGSRKTLHVQGGHTIYHNPDEILFVVNDLPKSYFINAVRHEHLSGRYVSVISFEPDGAITPEFEAELETILESMGHPPIVRASDLGIKKPTRASKDNRQAKGVYLLNEIQGRTYSYMWKGVGSVPSGTKFYVPIKYMMAQFNGQKVDIFEFRRLYYDFQHLMPAPTPVYGLNQEPKEGEWINLFTWLQEQYVKGMTPRVRKSMVQIRGKQNAIRLAHRIQAQRSKPFSADSPMAVLAQTFTNWQNVNGYNLTDKELIIVRLHKSPIMDPVHVEVKDFYVEDLTEQAEKLYPLLAFGWFTGDQSARHFALYTELMDRHHDEVTQKHLAAVASGGN